MVVRNLEVEMPPGWHSSRINTLELKTQIVRKIGYKRAEKYFHCLTRFLSLRLNKSEFDKLCIVTIGRENISLHNQLIRSIIKNACLSKSPPVKGGKLEDSLHVKVANGYQRSLKSLSGDVFPPSPRKGRSPNIRDRKCRDRPSPLGPHGKIQTVMCEELARRPQEQQSATELLSLGSRPLGEVISVEDGEEVEQMADSPSVQSRSPVRAPLGIPINLGVTRKTIRNGSIYSFQHETCRNSGELPDTRSLRNRLKQKLEMDGLRIPIDCVNVLNNGVDAFLKRLIKPCLELAESRCRNEHVKQLSGQVISGLNGMRPGRHMQISTRSFYASMLDFRVAMETNPRILGQDWPIQLEKICLHTSEE